MRWIFLLLTLLLVLLLCVLGFSRNEALGLPGSIDKQLHFTGFALLTLLIYASIHSLFGGLKRVVIVLGVCITAAFVSEYVQGLLPVRLISDLALD